MLLAVQIKKKFQIITEAKLLDQHEAKHYTTDINTKLVHENYPFVATFSH